MVAKRANRECPAGARRLGSAERSAGAPVEAAMLAR